MFKLKTEKKYTFTDIDEALRLTKNTEKPEALDSDIRVSSHEHYFII